MEVGIGKQKLASRNLRVALAGICEFVDVYLKGGGGRGGTGDSDTTSAGKQILVACETGKDLSIGVVLALVCRFFDDEGRYKPWTPDSSGVNKSIIKTKLGRIMLAFPQANPSRTTLQSVNSYLMG
ncbi:hypothetical protein RRF57_006670 [Xylaria bambusicola]|uniref:Rit1 DUSP-like domain-containing protein n=1 Tax=Xylaria bambusicola TaxID=326684 RepID=A0AAN7UET1_9PEZI